MKYPNHNHLTYSTYQTLTIDELEFCDLSACLVGFFCAWQPQMAGRGIRATL